MTQPEALTDAADRRALWRIGIIVGLVTAAWLLTGLSAYAGQGTVIGSRPSGCPHKFCGCALSLKLFGKIIPKFNLAANWKQLPRTPARPGAVAARPGHVLQLIEHRGGNKWLTWDANSGGGKTRIHVRDVSRYTFHDPFTRVAMRGQ